MKQTINPSGVNHDIAAGELGPETWNDVQNVTFNNGYAVSGPGYAAAMAGALFKPLYLLGLETATVFYWLYIGNNDAENAGGVGVTDGATHWDITPAGGLTVMAAGEITGGVLNGIPVLNNGADAPIYWDTITANPMLELPGWPAAQRCGSLRVFKYHLIAMNITDGGGSFPELVAWSDAANPGAIPQEWVSTPENQAGNFTISATTGGIVDGGQMRDQFMIYKTHSSTVMQYIAGQFVFSNRKAFVTSGILARNCWAEMYGQHYVITDGDFIQHNGQEVKSLIDGKNRNYLFDQISADTYKGCYLVASHADKQLWLAWPKPGDDYTTEALVYDIKSDEFGQVNLPNIAYIGRGIIPDPGFGHSWDEQIGQWDNQIGKWDQQLFNPTTDALLMADYVNKRFLVQGAFSNEGDAIPVLLQLLSKDLGEPQQYKLITGLWINTNTGAPPGSGNLAVRIGTQAFERDAIKWSPAYFPTSPKSDFMVSGRFISIELTAQTLHDWRLNSLDLDYELQGLW